MGFIDLSILILCVLLHHQIMLLINVIILNVYILIIIVIRLNIVLGLDLMLNLCATILIIILHIIKRLMIQLIIDELLLKQMEQARFANIFYDSINRFFMLIHLLHLI